MGFAKGAAEGSALQRFRDRKRQRTESKQPKNSQDGVAMLLSRYKRLKGARLPIAVLSLPHVMERIDSLLMTIQEAAAEAAKHGDWLTVENFLDVLDGDVVDVAIAAAENGHYTIVRHLLDEIGSGWANDDDRAEYWRILEAATANGHSKIVQLCMECATQEPEQESFFVENYGEVICPFITDIPEEGRWEAMSRPISGGHVDVVKELLDPERVCWDVAKALEQAIVEGQNEIAEVLYKSGLEYAEAYRHSYDMMHEHWLGAANDFFVSVSRGKHVEVTRFVCKKGGVSSVGEEAAFQEASTIGNTDVMEFLIEKISPKAFDAAFEKAVQLEGMKTLAFLYNKHRVSAETLRRTFERTRSIAVIKFLHGRKCVSPHTIIEAFRSVSASRFDGPYRAPKSGEVARYLVDTGHIPGDVIKEVFVKAAEWGPTDVVKALWNEKCITLEVGTEAFTLAAKNGNTPVVELLFDRQNVSRPDMLALFANSIDSWRLSTMKFLYDKRQVSSNTVLEMYSKAAGSGDYSTMQALSGLPCISQAVRDEAFATAIRHNQVFVVEGMSRKEKWSVEMLDEALKAVTSPKIQEILHRKRDEALGKNSDTKHDEEPDYYYDDYWASRKKNTTTTLTMLCFAEVSKLWVCRLLHLSFSRIYSITSP